MTPKGPDPDPNHERCGCSPNCLCRTAPPAHCAWHAIGRRFEDMIDRFYAQQGWPPHVRASKP